MAAKNYWVSEYFHVIVDVGDSNRRVLFTDLSKQSLKTQFLEPYRRGQKILHLGEFIDLGNLSKLHIIRTTKPKSEELEELQISSRRDIDEVNARSSGFTFISIGYGWNDEDIVFCGDDVTSQFIQPIPSSNWYLKDFWQIAGVVVAIVGVILAYLALK